MGTKVLWRPCQQKRSHDDSATDSYSAATSANQSRGVEDEELEFHRIRNLRHMDEILNDQNNNLHYDDDDDGDERSPSLIVTTPPQRPLIEIVNQSLVVVQEVALAVILLAVHREIVIYEESQEQPNQKQQMNQSMGQKSSLAMIIVYATMFVIVYYNRQSSTLVQVKRQRRRRAIVRLSDGFLLAALLRFISGVLRSLTASYSTDTVYALAISGLAIHLLACDYNYANGVLSVDLVDGASSSSNNTSSAHHPRPAFLGGTVSLNSAFFSTVLLISRIKSNVFSYAFVSSVVTLFAFYPASRHNIAGSYPNTVWGSPCLVITAALSLASWLLLSPFEQYLFAALQSLVFVISPCLQWWLQRHKQIITGTWDIAHIRSQS